MTPEFYLVLDGDIEDDKLIDAIYEAGFDDCLVCGRGNGRPTIWVTNREGELLPLIKEAIGQANRGGIKELDVLIDPQEIERLTQSAKPQAAEKS